MADIWQKLNFFSGQGVSGLWLTDDFQLKDLMEYRGVPPIGFQDKPQCQHVPEVFRNINECQERNRTEQSGEEGMHALNRQLNEA